MLVTAIVFAIGAVSIRLTDNRGSMASTITLGALLGLGYLAKAAMFPVGVVVIGTLGIMRRRQRRTRQPIIAGVIFLAISAPEIAYVSHLKGSPTFGDVGRLSYLWFIADVPGPVSSAFPLPASLPSHDARNEMLRPLDATRDPHPAVYDIDAPIPGTLPIWYDADYWFRGVVAPFLPLGVIRAIVRHARVYLEVFGFLLVGAVGATLAGRVTWSDLRAMRPAPLLVWPPLAALAMYALVLVQTRYVAPFALLLFAGLVPPWATDDLSRRLRVGLAAGAVAIVPLMAHQARVDATAWRGSAESRATLVAALAARGVAPGTRIGFIGEAYDALWARPARLRFVSLLPLAESSSFWALRPAKRATIIAHMQQQGAKVVIAERPAIGVNTDGWEPLPSAGAPRPELIVYGGMR
jgi:hypothetical protein